MNRAAKIEQRIVPETIDGIGNLPITSPFREGASSYAPNSRSIQGRGLSRLSVRLHQEI
jgi:hypothetical protein